MEHKHDEQQGMENTSCESYPFEPKAGITGVEAGTKRETSGVTDVPCSLVGDGCKVMSWPRQTKPSKSGNVSYEVSFVGSISQLQSRGTKNRLSGVCIRLGEKKNTRERECGDY